LKNLHIRIQSALKYNDRFSTGMAMRFESNFFLTQLSDTFITEEVELANGRGRLRINGGDSSVYGLEFTGDASYKNISINGSFTAQRSKLDDPEPDFNATRFFKAPDYYGSLTAIYTTESYNLALSYNYTGSMLVPHYAGYINEDRLEETEDFHEFNLRLEVPFNRLGVPVSLILMAKNITDAFQDDFDKGPDRDAGYVYGPRQPRTISAGLKVSF
jgi:outer membrane receptor for ferrienterochelin and colicins